MTQFPAIKGVPIRDTRKINDKRANVQYEMFHATSKTCDVFFIIILRINSLVKFSLLNWRAD